MAEVNVNVWPMLHNDLLDEIAKRIDYSVYVRLRAVCKEWNFELPMISEHIKNPWLVLPFEEDQNDGRLRPSYSFVEDKVHHLDLSESQKTKIRGSCYGWLIAVGLDGSVRMLNPFTRAQVNLPPLSTFPDVIDYQSQNHGMEYTRKADNGGMIFTSDSKHMQTGYVEKIIISSPPDRDNPDFMAIAIFGGFSQLAYCRRDDNKWRKVPETKFENLFGDAIFHEGKIYAVDGRARLFEFDTKPRSSPPRKISEASPPADLIIGYTNLHNKYVVGTPNGLLMVIRRLEYYAHHKILNGKEKERCYRTSGFEIYKMKKFDGQCVWSRVYDLGGYVLLVGFNSSLCLLPNTFPDAKGNRIYYTDNMIEAQYSGVIGGHDIGVFDLDEGRVYQLYPNSDLISPAPVWLLHKVF